MRVEEEFESALQNIEFIIVHQYRENPSLLDYDVEDVLKALSSQYYAEQSGRNPRTFNFSDKGKDLYTSVKEICEFLLGRESTLDIDLKIDPLSLQDLDKCLKRLLKSHRRWHRQGGRQGYLGFISQFL